jgi:hypothetical protein
MGATLILLRRFTMRNVKFYVLTLYRADGTNEVFEVTEWPKRGEIPAWCVRMDVVLPVLEQEQFYVMTTESAAIDASSWVLYERSVDGTADVALTRIYDEKAAWRLLELLNS